MPLAVALCLLGLAGLALWPVGQQRRDPLGPRAVNSLWAVAGTVPYLLVLSHDPSVLDHRVVAAVGESRIDNALLWFGTLYGMGFTALIAGTQSRAALTCAQWLPLYEERWGSGRAKLASPMALGFATAGYLLFLLKVGGVGFLLTNLESRSSLQAGNNYLLSSLSLLPIGVGILIYQRQAASAARDRLVGAGALMASAVLLATLGGRKPVIGLFVSSLFVYHYGVARLRRPKLGHVIVAAMLAVFFVVNPVLRSPGGLESVASDPSTLLEIAEENGESLAVDLSYVYAYVFVTDQFDSSNVWLGRSYLDLSRAALPSSLSPSKPPVDDGVYIRSLAEGLDVSPGSPFTDLYPSSWPGETFATTYMNFWVPGILLGMYVVGFLHSICYHYMVRTRFQLWTILLYANTVNYFELSNLRIVQALTHLAVLFLFCRLFLLHPGRTTGPPHAVGDEDPDERLAKLAPAAGGSSPESRPRHSHVATASALAPARHSTIKSEG